MCLCRLGILGWQPRGMSVFHAESRWTRLFAANEVFECREDADFSVRAAHAEFRSVVVGGSVMRVNEEELVGPERSYYRVRNEIRFWGKYVASLHGIRLRWESVQRSLLRYSGLEADSPVREAVLAGIWDGLLDRSGRYAADRRMPALPAMLARTIARRVALRYEAGDGSSDGFSRA